MRRPLDGNYHAEVDMADKGMWTDVVARFDDTFLYQTWTYGAVRWGEKNLSHLVLRKGNSIVAAAQVRVVKPPLLRAGIAYVTWGPMWRVGGCEANPEVFRQMIRAMREEYACRRRLLLRLVPNELAEEGGVAKSFLEGEGFRRCALLPAYRTVLIDLRRTVDDLRKGLRGNWRRDLARAEQDSFEIDQGAGLHLYDAFCELYREMMARKRFIDYVDIDEFRRMQQELPSAHKMGIMICRLKGKPLSAVVWSGIGKTALLLLAATSIEGRERKAGYYLKWQEILWLKRQGYEWYDFGGVNPVRNPAGYKSKVGVLGKNEKNGIEAQRVGVYDTCDAILSGAIVKSADLLRLNQRRLREKADFLLHGPRKRGMTGTSGRGGPSK